MNMFDALTILSLEHTLPQCCCKTHHLPFIMALSLHPANPQRYPTPTHTHTSMSISSTPSHPSTSGVPIWAQSVTHHRHFSSLYPLTSVLSLSVGDSAKLKVTKPLAQSPKRSVTKTGPETATETDTESNNSSVWFHVYRTFSYLQKTSVVPLFHLPRPSWRVPHKKSIKVLSPGPK